MLMTGALGFVGASGGEGVLETPWNRHQVHPEVAHGEGPHEGHKVGPAHCQGDHDHLPEALIEFRLYKKNERCRHVRLVVSLHAEA